MDRQTLKHLALITLSTSLLIHLVAAAICFRFFAFTAKEYGTVLFWAAAGFAMLGVAFSSGPTASGGASGPVAQYTSPGSPEDYDRIDRERAFSLGLLLFSISAINCTIGLWLAGVIP